jgi:hypothetical protein
MGDSALNGCNDDLGINRINCLDNSQKKPLTRSEVANFLKAKSNVEFCGDVRITIK